MVFRSGEWDVTRDPGRRVEWWGAFLVPLPLNVAFFSKGGLVESRVL